MVPEAGSLTVPPAIPPGRRDSADPAGPPRRSGSPATRWWRCPIRSRHAAAGAPGVRGDGPGDHA